jgi:hypothetical protein
MGTIPLPVAFGNGAAIWVRCDFQALVPLPVFADALYEGYRARARLHRKQPLGLTPRARCEPVKRQPEGALGRR